MINPKIEDNSVLMCFERNSNKESNKESNSNKSSNKNAKVKQSQQSGSEIEEID